jgi:hypothetical protein
MTVLETIIHNPRDESGEPQGGVEYVFSDDPTEWQKEAIREYGVQSKDEIQDALDWRDAVDKLPTETSRAMRGKDPETGGDVGRGRGRRGGQ